ncbi:MAG: LysR family transcriptional regulator [Thiofilum sp.]|uniref:LysR family transcriptional regulator n=1 Tax=Thiofilum sp. TaxID=2212733 RepID=UPI0025FD1BC8|nr:LysR family transcriptional regulator [Thiofilum sp.]MBK8451788.1 LysR family transcriptional regulator [Thiofilum sp.]
MDIQTLNAFIEVARLQSFSKAAEVLFVTQPAISKRITALETELGTLLFNRINRKVTLTEAGQVLLPKVQNLRNELTDIRRIASNLSSTVNGELVMGTSHHIGLHRLPPILKAFNQHYPEVRLDLRFVSSEEACLGVEQGDLELAVITLPSTLPEQLQAQTLWVDPLHIVVSPEHPLALAPHTDITTLASYRCVLPSPETYTYQIIAQAFAEQNQMLNTYLSTNYLETLKMLVVAGLGWSLLPETLLDQSVVVLKTALQLQRPLGIITHRKRSLSNAARHFLELMTGSS